MKLGETIASRRRIGPLQALDDSSAPVLGEDFSGAGELELDLDGAGFGASEGTVLEIGVGYYAFEAPAAAAVASRWAAVKLSGVCQEFTFREDVERDPNGITVGESDATKRRIGPLHAVLAGVKLTELDLPGVTVEITINASPWAVAGGALEIHTDGYPYYVAPQAEVMEIGWIAVKLSGGCDEFTMREDIVAPSAETEVVEPTVPGTPVPVVFDDIPVIDPVSLALARLPQQYRGTDDIPTELLE